MLEVSGREKRRSFFTAIGVALMVMLVAAPIAQATHHAVKIKGAVKIKDSNGVKIESKVIPDMGLLQAPGSAGAIATRTFAGGGGFLGAGDCTESTEPQLGPLPDVVSVSNAIVTGIIITGTSGKVTVTSAAVGNNQLPLSVFRVNAENPNEFVGLGNGLTATAPLQFKGSGEDGGNGACNFVILGQSL